LASRARLPLFTSTYSVFATAKSRPKLVMRVFSSARARAACCVGVRAARKAAICAWLRRFSPMPYRSVSGFSQKLSSSTATSFLARPLS